jgi:hypothetical protein
MSKLREAARNQPCLVRLPGCTGGGEDTVGAHYRSVSLGAGMGIKTNDIWLAWCCFHCHQIVDGRESMKHGPSRDQVRLALAEGVFRTQAKLFELGLLSVKGTKSKESA